MHLAQERIVILKVFDPFGRDDRVKTAVGPGKRAIQVYLLKGRSEMHDRFGIDVRADGGEAALSKRNRQRRTAAAWRIENARAKRSEEHTSELQSRENLVCRLLLEKKKRDSSSSATSRARR